MVNQSNDWVVIGKFGRVHGIKGLVSLHSFTEPPENIFTYQPLHIKLKKTWCPIRILSNEGKGDRLLVQVENYPSREDVAFLTNLEVAVPRAALPKLEDDVFYLHDLIKLAVVNLQDQRLGNVSEIISTGSNDILVIESDRDKILIPFVWEVFIKNIDLDHQIICVDWELDDSQS